MPTRIILNPHADLGHGLTHLEKIREAAKALDNADIVLTERADHAQTLAAEAIEQDYDLLVAAGGDGTVNEIANSMMKAGKGGLKLGIIPLGTGNDFAHAMGIPKDVDAAVDKILAGRTRAADMALLEDDKGRKRYFQNNMGVGFDANVVIRTAQITKLRGFPKYLVGVLTALALDYRPVHLRVKFDEEEVSQSVLFLFLGIGPRGGGGFLLTPDASHSDDRVDSCTVSMLGRSRALFLINAAIKGTHIHTPYVTMRQSKQIVINSGEGMPIQVDGEIYASPADEIHHLIITSLPAALEVIA